MSHCQKCSSVSVCLNCDLGYYADSATGYCVACSMIGCKNCSDSSTCLECDITNNYVLIATNHTCSLCPIGFVSSITQSCDTCNILGCSVCSTLTTCQTCDTANSYYLSIGGCALCNNSLNTFLNQTSLNCEPCLVPNCITCSSLTACSICNASLNYFVNSSTGLC